MPLGSGSDVDVPLPNPPPPPTSIPDPVDDPTNICGNGRCEGTKTCYNCPEDCGECSTTNIAVSKETIVYDTVEDAFTRIPDSRDNRMAQFSGGTNEGTAGERLYVLSGYIGSINATESFLSSCEVMDIATEEWKYVPDIPTSRAFGMSITHNDKIYCIGGVTLDPVTNMITVSRKIESFSMTTETWNPTLKPMPVDYGVWLGDAQVVGDYIYVTCGARDVSGSDPKTLNNKILRYSINSDKWVTINVSNEELYKRLSPFAFYRGAWEPAGTDELFTTFDVKPYYILGGSIPKSQNEIRDETNAMIEKLTKELHAFVNGSNFYQTLDMLDSESYIAQEEANIKSRTSSSAFVYPWTGFKFLPGTETNVNGSLFMDISDTLEDEWPIIPKARDDGKAVYVPDQDIVYFVGGSNQNVSTTLKNVESISLDDGMYAQLTSMNRGRTKFATVLLGEDVYILGGMTSGHNAGYVQVHLEHYPVFIEARGEQSDGFFVSLLDDSGDFVDADIRVSVRGRLRMKGLDDVMSKFFAKRASERVREQLPYITDEAINSLSNQAFYELVCRGKGKLVNPNSDEFQIDSGKKLDQEMELFPILYNTNDFIVSGIGGFILLPRSEDPLVEFEKLSEFINGLIDNTLPATDERLLGNLTREELAALGDALESITLPPTIINSGSQRIIYEIETLATVVDDYFFGQTISDINEQILNDTMKYFENMMNDIRKQNENTEEEDKWVPPTLRYDYEDTLLGNKVQDGQSLSSDSKIPFGTTFKDQLPTVRSVFYNYIDWIPQIHKYITDAQSIAAGIEMLDTIDHQTPFGSSQLYNALFEASRVLTEGTEDKKMIYVGSDNSENLSLVTRDQAIVEVNSIDGDGQVPIIYTVFSTSEPATVSAHLQRTERRDVQRMTRETNGQSTTLIRSSFLDQVLNFTLSSTGGMGYGTYVNQIDFGDISAITSVVLLFELPVNTYGTFKFRYSKDGYDFSDWSQKFEGSQTADLDDFYAKIVEYEIVLATGFVTSIEPEYDTTATGSPKLISITWDTSEEKVDYLYVESANVLTNTQQIAVAVEGHVPTNAVLEIGAATSISHEWRDYYSDARPFVQEFGRIMMLERTYDDTSLVPKEHLTTEDGYLWRTVYGSWDPVSEVTLYQVNINTHKETEITEGFRIYPRHGEIYFGTKQPLNSDFRLSIINDNKVRIGVRIRNRLHLDSVKVEGLGYIYSTNDNKPNDILQLPPIADKVHITPFDEPSAGDTFFVLYEYKDPNDDDESGTEIKWFKNSMELIELQNKVSWDNSDLKAEHVLEPGDVLTVSVKPKDGKDFGTDTISSGVTIIAREPQAQNIGFTAWGGDEQCGGFYSKCTYVLQYTFVSEDQGSGSDEQESQINWFVNGTLKKEGIYSASMGKDADILKLAPIESAGFVAHQINDTISADVTPRNASSVVGQKITAPSFTVINTIPVVENDLVQLLPLSPNPTNELEATFNVVDIDFNMDQEDQSDISWFRRVGIGAFEEITDPTYFSSNKKKVTDTSLLSVNDQWKIVVTPADGLDEGSQVTSNMVTIIQAQP